MGDSERFRERREQTSFGATAQRLATPSQRPAGDPFGSRDVFAQPSASSSAVPAMHSIRHPFGGSFAHANLRDTSSGFSRQNALPPQERTLGRLTSMPSLHAAASAVLGPRCEQLPSQRGNTSSRGPTLGSPR